MDRTRAIPGQLIVQSAREIDRVQILTTYERDVTAARRNLRVIHLKTLGRQRTQLDARLRVEVVQPQPLAHAKQQFAAVGRPAIRDDALELRDAFAFATRFLRVRQFLLLAER